MSSDPHDDIVTLVGHVLAELHSQVERLSSPSTSNAWCDRRAELRRAVELVRMAGDLADAAAIWRARQ